MSRGSGHIASADELEPGLSTVPPSALQDLRKPVNARLAGNDLKPRSVHTSFAPGIPLQSGNSARKSILKRVSRKPDVPLKYSSVASSRLVGTPSAKLSYLLDRVVDLYRSEKILIFYEGDDIAYYCAQALEILEIPHRIYAAGIKRNLRNQYQNEFNHDEAIRVMLVDLNQAALGLHLASASRVFFINPVWQPGLEAQAIKRAHRIGSKKEIKTETLVLKGTLEEELLHRRESMNAEEHRKASRSLLDDAPMKRILQRARLAPLTNDEIINEQAQIAKFKRSRQVFARSIADAYDGHDDLVAASIAALLKRETDAPDATTTVHISDTEVGNNSNESIVNRGLKRKLVFVDELERPETLKSRRLSISPKDQRDEPSDIPNRSSGRKALFADEANLPLHTIHHYEEREYEVDS